MSRSLACYSKGLVVILLRQNEFGTAAIDKLGLLLHF